MKRLRTLKDIQDIHRLLRTLAPPSLSLSGLAPTVVLLPLNWRRPADDETSTST
jgi:hypothetical protein